MDGSGAMKSGRPGQRSTVPAKRSADAQEEAWVADEDRFVLRQAKKKAEIRVKEGRPKPIDWLAVLLRVVEPDPVDDDGDDSDLPVVNPDGIFDSLDVQQLEELEKDINAFASLEQLRANREYWNSMKIICGDRRQKLSGRGPEGRAISSVSSDIDRTFSNKTYDELQTLERQVNWKIQSNEPIDYDYWEQLLRTLRVWKAKAKLRNVYQSVIEDRRQKLRHQQAEEAKAIASKLQGILGSTAAAGSSTNPSTVEYSAPLDPEPMLKLRLEDKALELIEEKEFLKKVNAERRKVLTLGFVPMKQRQTEKLAPATESRVGDDSAKLARFANTSNEDFSQATRALYEREVARGVGENEEIFTGEEDVVSTRTGWTDKHRPRKPRYFNRVQMGYEWNKYNQTHYDHDNPPPKIVQGYKFNIFYPDLIDKTKAPTYRIERENGRKRGQTFAPAGEEDTCLIRFIAGPPYEDIAFRIVDKEWDYSAKRERGFKSSFDKGILQLHFQFKKIYYRK
ncbi:hypothetical protein L228DRAFT_97486 [Xylona heveae TC161]|uniref:Splicing factor Cactin n=1 Tax=Xylona heveae (strain CBS 132557 / TC161) TaxID=1328760 RepID=A0A161TQ79_XYLHT|nr:hypothetical protein L228DRAFT_97486 [Xylona heveae TC161]KZF24466.1 hypothetical protein L228DRAFT_97486 [Xylona heveae TC161]